MARRKSNKKVKQMIEGILTNALGVRVRFVGKSLAECPKPAGNFGAYAIALGPLSEFTNNSNKNAE